MDLRTITDRFDEQLSTADYSEVDASANGLQVGPPNADIDHVAFAVDAAEATIEQPPRPGLICLSAITASRGAASNASPTDSTDGSLR